MEPEEGLEPPLPGSEPGVLPLDDSGVMAGEERLERSSAASKTAVLPLDDSPVKWSGHRELSPALQLGRLPPRPLGHARLTMKRPARIELAPPGREPSRLPLTYGRVNGGCGETRTLNQRFKRPLRSSVAPRTQEDGASGRTRTCTSPLKRRLLTTELRRHDWGASRPTGARERALARCATAARSPSCHCYSVVKELAAYS
jgi:hypothetical protein